MQAVLISQHQCHQCKGCKAGSVRKRCRKRSEGRHCQGECCRICWLWAGRAVLCTTPRELWRSLSITTAVSGSAVPTGMPFSPPAEHWLVELTFSFPDLRNTQRAEAACREAERQETRAAWIPIGLAEVSRTRRLATSLLLPPTT